MGLFSRKTPEEKFVEKCSKGDELFQRERYDEALEKFLESEEITKKAEWVHLTMLSKMFCNMSECYYHIAHEMMDAQNKRAIESGFDPKSTMTMDLSSKQDPTQEIFLKGLAYCDKALDTLTSPQAWFWKGNLLEKIHRYQVNQFHLLINGVQEIPTRTKDAIECYEKAVRLDPTFQGGWFQLAMVLNVEKEFEKSIECYDKVIKINPDSDVAKVSWNNMGCAYDILCNREEADKCYANAKEFDST